MILKPFLRTDTTAYLFSPRLAMEERRAARRLARQTPMTPSQAKRKSKRRPKKAPGEAYTTGSYAHAIRDACEAAWPAPEDLKDEQALVEWRRQHGWHPHQLRHTALTKLRREFGIDVARSVAGHHSPAVTEVYAEVDAGKAAEAMAKMG